MNTESRSIKNILLVEDDMRDVELTMAALEEHHLANKVEVVHDGADSGHAAEPQIETRVRFRGCQAGHRNGRQDGRHNCCLPVLH